MVVHLVDDAALYLSEPLKSSSNVNGTWDLDGGIQEALAHSDS